MNFQVSREYARGGESHFARFTERSDAEQFINMKRESDQLMKLKVIYRLYEGSRLLGSFGDDESSLTGGFSGQQTAAATGGRGTGSSFQPTPFNTAPRPGGVPHNWVKDKDDQKSEDTK